MIPLWIGLILVAFVSFFVTFQSDNLRSRQQSMTGEQLVISMLAFQTCMNKYQTANPTVTNQVILPAILLPYCPVGYRPNDFTPDDIWTGYVGTNRTYYVYTNYPVGPQVISNAAQMSGALSPIWGTINASRELVSLSSGDVIQTDPIPAPIQVGYFTLVGKT